MPFDGLLQLPRGVVARGLVLLKTHPQLPPPEHGGKMQQKFLPVFKASSGGEVQRQSSSPGKMLNTMSLGL